MQHQHLHRRVSDAEQALEDTKVHLAQRAGGDAVETLYSVVYVTMPATFSGPTAGYVTVGGPYSTTSSTPEASGGLTSYVTLTTSKSASPLPASSSLVPSRAQRPDSSASDASSVASVLAGTPLAGTRATSSALALSSTTLATAPYVVGTPIQATSAKSSATGLSTTTKSSSSSMSSGAKAGLAFGIIALLALALGLVVFCVRRRKNKNAGNERLNDEKTPVVSNHVSDQSVGSARNASAAPRLSLRPVTQFLPMLATDRKSGGNTLGGTATNGHLAPAEMSEKPASAWERRPAQNSVNDPKNPFGTHAEKVEPVVSEKRAASPTPAVNPFAESEDDAPKPIGIAPSQTDVAAHTKKPSREDSELPNLKSTQTRTVPVIGGAAEPMSPRGPNNVHRVQLEFKPSMEDELELRAGQLVRMLHEYDDGWALCIRMDRSQQGV
ncbi:hypothetical protein LTR66_013163, partial [Elasticomyces elasticus]